MSDQEYNLRQSIAPKILTFFIQFQTPLTRIMDRMMTWSFSFHEKSWLYRIPSWASFCQDYQMKTLCHSKWHLESRADAGIIPNLHLVDLSAPLFLKRCKSKCCPPFCLSRDEWRKDTPWKYQDKFQFECLFFPFVVLLSVQETANIAFKFLRLLYSSVSLTNERSWSHPWQTSTIFTCFLIP